MQKNKRSIRSDGLGDDCSAQIPGSPLNLVFHGLFGFSIDGSRKTIKVFTPIVADHTYAVRVSDPLTATPSAQAPDLPYPVFQNGVSVNFGADPTQGPKIDSTYGVVIPKLGDGTKWQPTGVYPYFSFDVPYPRCILVYRNTTKPLAGVFSGNDAPPDSHGKKYYAIVHRFIYDISPQDVSVKLDAGDGSIDVLGGVMLNKVTVHFYAESLYPEDHAPSNAFSQLVELYSPTKSPGLALSTSDNVNGSVNAAQKEAGQEFWTTDEQDIGEYLNGLGQAISHRGHDLPKGIKLRNCISVYFDNSQQLIARP